MTRGGGRFGSVGGEAKNLNAGRNSCARRGDEPIREGEAECRKCWPR